MPIKTHRYTSIVTLSGRVQNLLARQIAANLAQHVRGMHMANYLNVRKQWVPRSDAAIQADLNDKFTFAFVEANNQVTGQVEDGVAILRGTVDTWLMWQTAIDLALEAGARRPHNLIAVRYGASSAPRFHGTHYYVSE